MATPRPKGSPSHAHRPIVPLPGYKTPPPPRKLATTTQAAGNQETAALLASSIPKITGQGEKGRDIFRGFQGEWKEIDRSRTEDVHGPIPGAGQEDLARHRLPPRPPANSRAEEAQEGGEDLRVPRRAHHVGDAEGDGLPGAPGGEGGHRRRGHRDGRRRQEEEGGVEPLRLLLLRVLSSTGRYRWTRKLDSQLEPRRQSYRAS